MAAVVCERPSVTGHLAGRHLTAMWSRNRKEAGTAQRRDVYYSAHIVELCAQRVACIRGTRSSYQMLGARPEVAIRKTGRSERRWQYFIILKYVLKEWILTCGMDSAGLEQGPSDWPLWTRWWSFRFRPSWPAEEPSSASENALCSIKLCIRSLSPFRTFKACYFRCFFYISCLSLPWFQPAWSSLRVIRYYNRITSTHETASLNDLRFVSDVGTCWWRCCVLSCLDESERFPILWQVIVTSRLLFLGNFWKLSRISQSFLWDLIFMFTVSSDTTELKLKINEHRYKKPFMFVPAGCGPACVCVCVL